MKRRRPDPPAAALVPAPASPRERIAQASPILLLVGIWLLMRPYVGISHDARLYAAQALHELKPEIFGHDMFFAFGSQDAFTLFSKLYAPLVDIFGLPAAAVAVVIIGQALWLSGAAALALRLTGSRPAALAGLFLLAMMPGTYGGWQLLRVAEGFPTPRLPAEAFGLWALWALSHRRVVTAGLLTLASAALHPIMSAAIVLTGTLFLISRDRRWSILALAGLASIALGALLGIPPLDRLLQTMDAEWFAIVQRNIYLYPGEWRPWDWSSSAFVLTLALGGAAVLPAWRRAIVLCSVLATAIGVGASYVGADLLHNVLLTQLQLYRTMWLFNVIGHLAAGALVVRVWRLDDGGALVVLLAIGSIVTFALLPFAGLVIVASAIALAVLRLNGHVRPLAPALRVAALSVAVLLALALALFRVISVSERVSEIVLTGHAPLAAFAYVTVLDVAILAVVTLIVLRYRANAVRVAVPGIAIVVLAASLLLWDRRDDWSRASTQMAEMGAGWDLPPDAQIFWENNPVGPWMILGRPSYVSTTQGGGIVFGRDTALAYRERIGVVQPLMQTEMIHVFRDQAAAHRPLPELDRAALVSTCTAGTELDALVLSRVVEGSYAAAWDTPAPVYDIWAAVRGIARPPIRRFYLYRCDDLRDRAASASASAAVGRDTAPAAPRR